MNSKLFGWLGLFGVVLCSVVFFLYKLIWIDISPSVFTILNEENSRLLISKDRTKLTGTFKAGENGLGIIFLNAQIRKFANIETLTFRLRTDPHGPWYYTRNIPEIDFYYIQPFPLGFPAIENSKNTTVQFELFNPKSKRPLFKEGSLSMETKYKASLLNAMADNTILRTLMRYKFLYALRYRMLYMFVALSFLPVGIYLFFMVYPQLLRAILRTIKTTRSNWQIALSTVVAFDIFILPSSEISITLFLVTLAGYLILIKVKRFSWQVLMFISGLLLLSSIIFVGTEYVTIAHKTSGWFFVCLTLAGALLFISDHEAKGKK